MADPVRLDPWQNLSAIKFASGEFLSVVLEMDAGSLNTVWWPHYSYGLYGLRGYNENNPSSNTRLLGANGKAKFYPYRASSYEATTANVYKKINGYYWTFRPNSSDYLTEYNWYLTQGQAYGQFARATYVAKQEEKPWTNIAKNAVADLVALDVLAFQRRPSFGDGLLAGVFHWHIWVNLKNLKTIWDHDWREKGLTFGLGVHKQSTYFAADPVFQPWKCRTKARYIPNASGFSYLPHLKSAWPDYYTHNGLQSPNKYRVGQEDKSVIQADWGTPVTVNPVSTYSTFAEDLETNHNWVFHLEVKTEVTGEPPNQKEEKKIVLTQEYKGNQT